MSVYFNGKLYQLVSTIRRFDILEAISKNPTHKVTIKNDEGEEFVVTLGELTVVY